MQSGAGVAPVLAEGCSVGKSEAPRIAVFNHVVQGAARALESHGFRLFFFFFSFYFSLPCPQQSQEVGELLADEQIRLFTSLSTDYPPATVYQASQGRSLNFTSSLVHTAPGLAHE